MREIINKFFSKESDLRNVTIEELLEENSVDKTNFWNYVHKYDIAIQRKINIGIKLDKNQITHLEEKIKNLTDKRKRNQEILDIYHLAKQENLTFGDISRAKNCTLKTIYDSLRNDYLKKMQGYSYEELFNKNMQQLRQKSEYKMYFYFLDHKVTFEELATQFSLDEAEVIYYFDSVVTDELLSSQIDQIFKINKNREEKIEKNNRNQQQQQKLNSLFHLTQDEIAQIDSIIASLKNKNETDPIYCQYKSIVHIPNPEKHIELLTYIKNIGGAFDNTNKRDNIDRALSARWIVAMLKPQILMKLKIRNRIKTVNTSKYSKNDLELLEYYLTLYSTYLNQPNINCDNLQINGINLEDGSTLDQKLHTNMFSKIVTIIRQEDLDKELTGKELEIYQYYQSHFILLKDLQPIFGICVEDYIQDFKKNHNQIYWNTICKIEKRRKNKIDYNINKLSRFVELMMLWRHYAPSNHYSSITIENELCQIINGKFQLCELERQKSYIESMLHSIQFTIACLEQDNYDTKMLEQSFNIKSSSTVHRYLYHPLVMQLLDDEIVEYIKAKRNISQILGQQKGRQLYIQNQSYKNNERNEKGQFVKKYKPTDNLE